MDDNNLSNITILNQEYKFCDVKKFCSAIGYQRNLIPYSKIVLLENLLRKCGYTKTKDLLQSNEEVEISFYPARVLMQDFTGVPAIVDLAAMRDAADKKADLINPMIPVDLVIDHSVSVDFYGDSSSLQQNIDLEFQRNKERYEFLNWGQQAFENFRVVPPGTGICHQVNLEYLAKVVFCDENNNLYFDTLVGTDSHTTMINALSVLGWGVGGIEAEAAMLGQPISMLMPKIVGFKLSGKMQPGVNATDLVLTITEILRSRGVVGKFVEFYGSGLKELTLADRATISNMSPEYGATCGFFPIDEETLKYLYLSGRDEKQIAIVENYAKAQGLWHDSDKKAEYDEVCHLDLSTVQPSLAGPKRPQDRVNLTELKNNFIKNLKSLNKNTDNIDKKYSVFNKDYQLQNGDIVISAITSCTNTSNPFALIGAGLVAKKAVKLGLQKKPWVKTSFAPGSKVVTEYLAKSGLLYYLEQLGFYTVGYGCTTCIGNSGPLNQDIADVIKKEDLVVAGILSGNRNFEGRIHPLVRANYLASPMLCIVYSIIGNINVDIKDGLQGHNLEDIWPTNEEINDMINDFVNRDIFRQKYSNLFQGDEKWRKIKSKNSTLYQWQDSSTYIKHPPFFEIDSKLKEVKDAAILAIFGDSITTDHISPAGNIAENSPAGLYLKTKGVNTKEFNSYGSRRGNHEVMMRGTFANIRIKNNMLDGIEGGFTKHFSTKEIMSIYDAAMSYQQNDIDTVIFAGKEYGTGSSRDWAAKGTALLNVKAVIAESFERIHRSNLIGMGVMPIMLKSSLASLELKGDEMISLVYDIKNIKPKGEIKLIIKRSNGSYQNELVILRADTELELKYLQKGGILQSVLKDITQ